jgi:hypothetical protein
VIASLLSSIAVQLNEGGLNYTVFLDAKVQPRGEARDPREYVRSAFGAGVVVDAIETTTGAVVVEAVESSLTFAGSQGMGPSQRTLDSKEFHLLVNQLTDELRKVIDTAQYVLEFRIGEGHPAYPVFWDFGFLFMLPDQVFILIGSSSD